MELSFSKNLIDTAGILMWVVPVFLGLLRGLYVKSGLFLLLLGVSGLIGWFATNIINRATHWNLEHEVFVMKASGKKIPEDLMERFASDGGAATFASLLGWLPACVVFVISFFVGYLIRKVWTSKIENKTE